MSPFASCPRSALTSVFALAVAASCSGHSLYRGEPTHNPDNSSGGVASSTSPGSSGGANSSGTGSIDGASGAAGPLPPFACHTVASQQFDAAHMQPYQISPSVTAAVSAALSQMSPADKASQLLGVSPTAMDYRDINRSPDVQVAGLGTIRGYWYRDSDRGVNLDAGQPNRQDSGDNFSTAFPAASVRAASWDLDLERRIGTAIGDETAASLNNVLLAPCMNIVRHPYWGRTQETYGEDMYQIGRMASAFTVGAQQYVIGCAKHFAANNIEYQRASVNAIMNEQTLREIYGRHFEMVVQDGGVGCIMASYNRINGVKSTQNAHLLGDILRAPIEQGGFGFQGLVLSDWWAVSGDNIVPDQATAQMLTNEALQAGLDIELPWTLHYSAESLARADPSLVEQAARRVLEQKYRFKTARDTDPWGLRPPQSTLSNGSITTNLDHEALAEEAELKSAVLLTNGAGGAPVLPLTAAAKAIAVIGPDEEFTLFSSTVPKTCVVKPDNPRGCNFHFSTDVALGDRGSSRVNADPARSVGPFNGIKDAAGSTRQVTSGNSVAAAASADTVVVIVGYTSGDEGEEFTVSTGGDRTTLDLPPGQNEFVSSALDLMKPTVIIIESGSIVNLPWLTHANQNQATIWAGYGGLRGGAVLGKLIFGAANFSGKMPMAWPTQDELDQQPFKGANLQTTMGYFFGYREYDRRKAAGQSVNLAFPFGHGSSYSSFEYSQLSVPCETVTQDAIVDISVQIKNTSAVDGDEIAMLFVAPPPKPAAITGDRPVKELKSFARVSVKAGQTVSAQLPLRIRDLRRWEGGAHGKWVIDSGAYTILVGKDADDAETAPTRAMLTVQAN